MRWNWLGIGLVACTLATTRARAGYTVVDLGVLPGGSVSAGAAINASGLVTGVSDSSDGLQAFLGNGGTPQSLGVLPGGTYSIGTALNGLGVAVGDADTGGSVHAFVSLGPGQISDLGVKVGWLQSHATGINDNGLISGYAVLAGNVQHAFVTDGSGHLTDLGTFPGGTNSRANGINAGGVVVGSADNASGVFHAFIADFRGRENSQSSDGCQGQR